MLDLPELNDIICGYLNRSDLVQCVRVSKRWYSAVIPYLWRDVSWISSRDKNMKAFCMMILKDYRAEQRHKELQRKEDGMDEPSQAQSPYPSLTLSKCGLWIRMLPGLNSLEEAFRPLTSPRQVMAPTSNELLLHLFKHCSTQVQVDFLSIDLDDLDLDSGNAVLDFSLPRLRRLLFRGSFVSRSSGTQKLMQLMTFLDLHVTALEILDLDADFSDTGMISTEDPTEDGPKGLRTLKTLGLHGWNGSADTKAFLSWMLKKCSSVNRLLIDRYYGITQPLVEGMLMHLPKLDEITFNAAPYGTDRTVDNMMAHILSGSNKGWRMAKFQSGARIGKATIEALKKHFSTLEILDMAGSNGVTGDHLVQVLGSCTRLHMLSNMYRFHNASHHPTINAKAFIDADPGSGALKPWSCEKTLKHFGIVITGIPRPDLKRGDTVAEEYPGQSQEIHGQVYDRLARLTNLETLWIGIECSWFQSDCLVMSLESGLEKLSGLKKMKVLDVRSMYTRIGVKEVQWMTEHWPRLREIYGLCGIRHDEQAVRWLRENRPDICIRKS